LARVQMPEGCTGLDMADGTRYSGKPGDMVTVEDRHASAINRSYYRDAGIMRGEQVLVIGTRAARTCTSCTPSRRWNVWNTSCPRCGAPTTSEEETA